MKRHLRMRTVLAGLAVGAAVSGLTFGTGGLANAESGAGSVVIRQFSCFVSLPPAPFLETSAKTQTVITPSGATALTCHFNGPRISDTLRAQGFTCGTFLGVTTDSRFVYTPSGQATLVCVATPMSSA